MSRKSKWDTKIFWSTRSTTVPAGSDHYFHTCCPYVRTYVCPSGTKLQNPATITAGRDCGLAKWIIDDSCLVFFFSIQVHVWMTSPNEVLQSPVVLANEIFLVMTGDVVPHYAIVVEVVQDGKAGLVVLLLKNKISTRQVSSMIHSHSLAISEHCFRFVLVC